MLLENNVQEPEYSEDNCLFCDKPCNGTYCSKDCKKADIND